MSAAQASTMPAVIKRFVGKPALIRGESLKEYREFADAVISDVEPEEIIEWLWTVRFVDCAWAALRWRRYRALYLDARHKNALITVMRASMFSTASSDVAKSDSETIPGFDVMSAKLDEWLADPTQLSKHNIDPDLISATALVQHVDTLEKIDRLIERAESQCDEVIQMLELRRDVFASRAREAANRARAFNSRPPEVAIVESSATPLPQIKENHD